ncbi:MAG TPA: hypothetical protein VJ808_14530, partial [Gemmatimonadales bacterium]|nr:hypothetical protein [Gemmatimonadales bacterium]
IPIGTFAQPTSVFGDRYNGAMRNIWPDDLLSELAAIKSRGGKVVLMFAGAEGHYKDANGHFDLGKWKARIDRYKGVNFSSYINDGTVIAHFLIDEPNDPVNWNGRPVSPAVLETMAEYSKQRWPGMPTVVRADPNYLGFSHRYLDAAWAQYVERKGSPGDYLRRNVADAQERGLGLVLGMNILKGGLDQAPTTATQVREWGSALLSGTYACAFISWKYDAGYLDKSGMREAMDLLAEKAQTRPATSCRGGGSIVAEPEPTEPAPSAPVTSGIPLKITKWTADGRYYMRLTWSGARGSTVDIYRNGTLRANTANDGRHTNSILTRWGSSYTFQVCETGTSVCSSRVNVQFN